MEKTKAKTDGAQATIASRQIPDMVRIVHAIDPGPVRSGYVVYDRFSKRVLEAKVLPTSTLVDWIGGYANEPRLAFVCEMVESYGAAIGATTIATAIQIGRLDRALSCSKGCGGALYLLSRREVKLYLLGRATGSDANVRDAIVSRYGPDRERAFGKKNAPGPLYGVDKHALSALALAITFCEKPDARMHWWVDLYP